MSETVCHFGHGCFAYDTGNCGNGSLVSVGWESQPARGATYCSACNVRC